MSEETRRRRDDEAGRESRINLMNLPVFNAALRESGLDAIVAVAGKSVVYLSGAPLPGTLGRLQDFPHTPRMNLLVWPRRGDPTLIVTPLSKGVAERSGWIRDLRPYEEYVESPMAALADILRNKGLSSGKVGIEKRYLGASRWEELSSLLPSIDFVECADLLEGVRNIKTDLEISLLKRAADMMDDTLIQVFAEAKAGDTERELHARVIASLLRRGAQYAHGMFRTSSNPVIYGGESLAPLKLGDIIQTDYVSYVDNYSANLSRVAVVGEPTKEQVKTYKVLLDVHRRTIETMLRPGVPAKDVFHFVGSELAQAGYPAPRALIGHCAGIIWHQEEPIMNPIEERPLKAGMVVCLEPRVFDYHVQDEILITDQEPQLLSDRFDTNRMFVIRA